MIASIVGNVTLNSHGNFSTIFIPGEYYFNNVNIRVHLIALALIDVELLNDILINP
jgi:hypothetical protein